MTETVAPVTAPTSPVVINFGGLRQPHVQLSSLKVNGAIFNDHMFGSKADFGQWSHEIRFESHDLRQAHQLTTSRGEVEILQAAMTKRIRQILQA